MESKIQIKRGNKVNLQTLLEGEPAFTIDTKELYIGDGINNRYFNSSNNNLIVNGNFQVINENFDLSGNIVIAPGVSQYIYGNYYITNDVTSLGNIIISKPSSGFITITSNNAKLRLEYRELLPEYKVDSALQYYNVLPLLNKTATFSFDYINSGSSINLTTGNGVDQTKTITLKTGRENISNTFEIKYKYLAPDYYLGILVLNNTVNSNYQISIGNLKLELGNTKSSFVPNPLYLDMQAIDLVYREYNATIRSVSGNVANTYNFYIPVIVPMFMNNKSCKITLNKADIYSLDRIKQSGLTVSKSSELYNQNVYIQATKASSLVLDSYLVTNFTIDFRIY